MSTNIKKLLLFAGDVLVLYFSLYLTLLLRYWSKPTAELWQSHFWPFTIAFIGWVIIFYIANLYDLHLAVNNSRFFQLTGRSLVIASLLSVTFFYLTPQITIAPKRNMLIYLIVFSALFFFWRQFFNWSLKAYLPKHSLAIIGYNDQVGQLIEELKSKPHLGYRVAFVVDDTNHDQRESNGVPVINKIDDLDRKIIDNKVTTMVLTSSPHQSPELRAVLFNCLRLKINYLNLSNFYETITGKIPIEAINQMWFLENLSEGSKSWFDAIKRLADCCLAILVLLITLPGWPLLGLLIKLESRGPIFFRQIRTGQHNKQFLVVKFRSMKEENNDRTLTKANDPRITKLGSFLRKTRIDEIPQVINIIRGEMSFVGPRPERPEMIKGLEQAIPFYKERTLVKPGITGWDQISGEYHSPSYQDSLKKLQYDLYYIKNRSIYLDLSIILKTLATILSRSGM